VTRSDWADYLDPAQQARSLDLLGDHLVRFGYATSESLARLREGLGEPEMARRSS
jgi:hypothetical protein